MLIFITPPLCEIRIVPHWPITVVNYFPVAAPSTTVLQRTVEPANFRPGSWRQYSCLPATGFEAPSICHDLSNFFVHIASPDFREYDERYGGGGIEVIKIVEGRVVSATPPPPSKSEFERGWGLWASHRDLLISLE